MSFSDSDFSVKNQSYYSQKEDDLEKSERNQKEQSPKSLNKYFDKKYRKKNKNKADDFNDNKNSKNVTKLYKLITKTLEKFIEKYYSDIPFVISTLKLIFSNIKSLLSSLNKEKLKEKQKKQEDNKNILYEFKIDDLNQQIKELKYELELLNTDESNKFNDNSQKKYKIYTYLKKKNSVLQNKSKLEQFKYLLYIREQQQKINELENQLRANILENLQEVKDSRCFPNITQYNIKEHLNPKSMPLTRTILKKSPKKKLTKISTPKKNDCFMTITNSISKYNSKTPRNIITDNTSKNTKKKKVLFKENIFKSIDLKKNEGNIKEQNTNSNNDIDYYFNLLKLNSEIIPNKDKKYFISHPNLNIAGLSQKLNKYNIGIPSKIFSFKFSKNIDKNAFYKFPSALNEIFVELEKLRINANKAESYN